MAFQVEFSIKTCFYTIIKRLGVTILLTPFLFYWGHFFVPFSGDGQYVEEMAEMDWVVLMHSPLTTIVHKCFYEALHPLGFTSWTAVRVSSSVAGALALQVLYAMRRHPLFLMSNVLSGSFLVFAGEVENYAWVNLCLYFTFLAVERYLRGEWRFWPAMTAFCLGSLFHLMTLFYLVPLFWVMKKYPRFHPNEFLLPFLFFVVSFVGMNLLLQGEGLFLDYTRLVPLFEMNRKGQFFTLFSNEHLFLLAKFHHWAAFGFGGFVIPLEWPALIFLWRRINNDFKKYLLFCTGVGLAWTTVWHPDLGPLDWDLFSHPYLIVHVLLGILLCEAWDAHRVKQKNFALRSA